MFEHLNFLVDPSNWGILLTLSAMEIVLGVDNLVLIAILSDKLPAAQRPAARRIGLIVALLTRLCLLSLIFMISKLMQPLFYLGLHAVSWRDLLLLLGGGFLIWKGIKELHENLNPDVHETEMKGASSFALIILQIGFMDIVFSFDSVMTAIGLAEHIGVMVTAVVIAMAVMLTAVNPISDFISRNPSIKVLALCYMLLIGVTLIFESMHAHLPRGMVYSAMGFSFFVEMMNLWGRQLKAKAELKKQGDLPHHPPVQ